MHVLQDVLLPCHAVTPDMPVNKLRRFKRLIAFKTDVIVHVKIITYHNINVNRKFI
jgi:hypothetical protein